MNEPLDMRGQPIRAGDRVLIECQVVGTTQLAIKLPDLRSRAWLESSKVLRGTLDEVERFKVGQ